MTTKPDVSAVIERGARRIACLALTHQGHQIAHLVVDEHPDLSDASGTFIIDTRGVAGARVYVRSEWTNRMGLVGAAGAGYFTVKGK